MNCTTSFVEHQPQSVLHASGNFWTIVPRGDGGEHGLSSGASGPVAPRDDGAIFLTAVKNQPRICAPRFFLTLGSSSSETQDMILLQHGVWRDEQTVRVCAEKRFLDTDSIERLTFFVFQLFHPRPHPRAHTRTHPRTPGPPEDDHDRIMLGFLKGLLFQLFIFFTKKRTFTIKEPPQKHHTKTESEYRAQQ